jgi:hypothetical protein
MILRRVGVGSAAKVIGGLCALLGLLIGAILTFLSVTGSATTAWGDSPTTRFMFGGCAIIYVPIVYGISGSIGAVILGLLYNLVAGILGGIELHVDDQPLPPQPRNP